MNFLKLLTQAKKESNSKICVGLDLTKFGNRENETLLEGQNKLSTLLSLISGLSECCCSFKVNRQYILDLTEEEVKQVTAMAHEFNRPIIIDHKISDIGSSNQQALLHIKKEGFDAYTASPFPGNIQEICNIGRSYGLASFILILMSNPEAIWMKECKISNSNSSNIPIFQYFTQLANQYATGIIIGATDHITNEDLKIIKSEISNKVILSPGIGAQKGTLERILKFFSEDVIFNVGRGIIYQKDPLKVLNSFNSQIRLISGN